MNPVMISKNYEFLSIYDQIGIKLLERKWDTIE